jgi:large subunit ribosomal protein L15
VQLNNLSPAPGSTKSKKRVGRGIGSGWGKTCGTGHKGQKSRSGGTVKPGFEGGQMPLQMRLPKYGFSSRISAITAEVRTSELNKILGDTVSLESLRKAGVITTSIKKVKVMLSGEVTRKLTTKGIGVSKGARDAIEKSGGKVIELEVPEKKKLVKKDTNELKEAKKTTAKASDNSADEEDGK